MACDIHIVAQRREGEKWRDVTGNFTEGAAPFDWRSYGMFGFFGHEHRNYSAVPAIAEWRGLPDGEVADEDEWRYGDYGFSWLSVDELAAFDYDATFEDRRVTRQLAPNLWSGGETSEPGGGKLTTYRDFLGGAFFRDLEELKRIGAERVVFGFDN